MVLVVLIEPGFRKSASNKVDAPTDPAIGHHTVGLDCGIRAVFLDASDAGDRLTVRTGDRFPSVFIEGLITNSAFLTHFEVSSARVRLLE